MANWYDRPTKDTPISENDELLLSDSKDSGIVKRIKAFFFKGDKGDQGDP
jgi:hypothetical protein